RTTSLPSACRISSSRTRCSARCSSDARVEEPSMTKMLDLIHMMQRGEIAPPPVAALIGFTLASVEPGCAVVEFEATPRHANPMGTLHGGVLCDIADAAMGMAWASTLDE